ncbi:formyl peptide receptor-like 1 inhibitory protein [Staphylococcus schweitzeri]|uniref:FPRL1 inhibitory protein n=1 Tax=Staphylococcus schweitzeri TaxID=1654388 RepID=A0A2K4ADL1_9STAP|nr:formyl peptide receptor-like 1 inhibitory protein [Staphylococcus schweitzeri]MBE2129235.1 formyl peptide receptor-like 1 inhibitory protein [Staphylococcus schweitzeri]PNZ48136.1 formyl peptide receptor-like 1 inhibitory protein [Staphylococcus schweitzeri]CDR26839.1 formyl peptide receptor-like 1 inhibitory protein [Staphylococcus schweitzeri]CDR53782.1 formyl peptide receptor-like 1 inhibitory protein [Staphylococcus schweitzeri]CDR60227.1 formyl peptide receptor-like 1 inhibitory protei
MKKSTTKIIIASSVIAVGLLTQTQNAKAYNHEWKILDILKQMEDDEKKDQARADRLIKEADEKGTAYKGKTVEDLYVIAKKLGKGNKKAVVKIKDGGPYDFYTFDITRPLEEHRKNIKVVKTGEISEITWQ